MRSIVTSRVSRLAHTPYTTSQSAGCLAFWILFFDRFASFLPDSIHLRGKREFFVKREERILLLRPSFLLNIPPWRGILAEEKTPSVHRVSYKQTLGDL